MDYLHSRLFSILYHLLLQILVRFNFESTTKELLRSFLRVVDIGIYSIAPIPDFVIGLLCDGHTKICKYISDCIFFPNHLLQKHTFKENSNLVQIGVLITHMRQLNQADLRLRRDFASRSPCGNTFRLWPDRYDVRNRGTVVGLNCLGQ